MRINDRSALPFGRLCRRRRRRASDLDPENRPQRRVYELLSNRSWKVRAMSRLNKANEQVLSSVRGCCGYRKIPSSLPFNEFWCAEAGNENSVCSATCSYYWKFEFFRVVGEEVDLTKTNVGGTQHRSSWFIDPASHTKKSQPGTRVRPTSRPHACKARRLQHGRCGIRLA